MAKNDDKQVRCSFCGKREGQVKRLIAGPGVFICDECIDLCCDILHDDYLETEMEEVLAGGENEPPLLKPAEIKKAPGKLREPSKCAKPVYLYLGSISPWALISASQSLTVSSIDSSALVCGSSSAAW